MNILRLSWIERTRPELALQSRLYLQDIIFTFLSSYSRPQTAVQFICPKPIMTCFILLFI